MSSIIYYPWDDYAIVQGDTDGSGSTDNALARYSGTSGNVLTTSNVILGDSGALTGLTSVSLSGITSGALEFSVPSIVTNHTLAFPASQGGASTVLTNNGSGVLTWVSNPLGAVVGPGSATDTAIVKYSGTTGKLVQDSSILVTSGNAITGVTGLALKGTTNSVTINPAAATAAYTVTLPAAQGASSTKTVAVNDGTGALTWEPRMVVLIGNVSNFAANTSTTFCNWGVVASNQTSFANTIRMGRAGRITMITATYINGTAIALTAGQSITFTVCYLADNAIPNAVTNFTNGLFLTWDSSTNNTFPAATVTVDFPFTATMQWSLYTTETGVVTSTTSDVNLLFYCELYA